jgi:protein tyrosine phosphatase (PTP) superfamily phosphohydrolase (DUF442 family)
MNNDYTPVKVDAPIVLAEQNCWQIGDHYITAQPTEPGLSVANGLGIQSVVCLRDATEVANPPYLPFDSQEDLTLTSLGMNFVNIPFPHSTTLTQQLFDIRAGAVLAVLGQLPKPLLMHCSSGDRASALWAVHLMVNCRLTKQGAIYYATLTGLAVFLPFVQNYPASPA